MSVRDPGDYRSTVRNRPGYPSGPMRTVSPGGNHHGIGRFLLFALLLGAIVLVGLVTLGRPLVASTVVGWANDNPSAINMPFVADFVQSDLGAKLTEPPSDDSTEVQFTVSEGETVRLLGDRLEDEGFVLDARAFVFTAVRRGVDDEFRPGNFVLRHNMTPAEVVGALLEPRELHTFVRVGLREGLRLEQITGLLVKLKKEQGLPFDADAFYDIVKNPPADLVAEYDWLKLPRGATLEGYLAPATYDVRDDATAETFVRQLLDQFEESVGANLTVPKARGMTLHQVVTLASIVEQEAQVDEERPLIAGVFQNRIEADMLFQADPTVVYAWETTLLDAISVDEWDQFFFWDIKRVPKPLDSVEVPAALRGYQSYQHVGLIDGPICTPSAASIAAALKPDTKAGYLFFVAIQDKDGKRNGRHAFAKTQKEHEANLRKYFYI